MLAPLLSNVAPRSGIPPTRLALTVPARRRTTVAIGMPSPALACGVEAIVQRDADLRTQAAESALDGFLAACAELDDDAIALVDPALGRLGIRAFMQRLRDAAPRMRVVLMIDAQQTHVMRVGLRAGAVGFVERSATAADIQAALATVAAGGRHVAPAMAGYLAESLTQDELTARELQVLDLLALGDCNKSIARALALSLATVKTHLRTILMKLQARSRTEAAHKAYRLGLIAAPGIASRIVE